MVTRLETLLQVADRFEAIVLDQWGVLHDGTAPYPFAQRALADLKDAGCTLAVLSNSGKRAAPNLDRITAMGFAPDFFDTVMTSGEALWSDLAAGHAGARRLYPIERAPGDAASWAEGLPVTFTPAPESADAILLMGLPDDAPPDYAHDALNMAHSRGVPVYCTNPDRASPRADGAVVTSPGALAHAHRAAGGDVTFYGKPHLAVFRAVEAALGLTPEKFLMVGDSLEHDIAGAAAAGWATAFVQGGLHAAHFAPPHDPHTALAALIRSEGATPPTYSLPFLR